MPKSTSLKWPHQETMGAKILDRGKKQSAEHCFELLVNCTFWILSAAAAAAAGAADAASAAQT
jgi:hypothetical protein